MIGVYEEFAKPGFYRFILPMRAEADLIVPKSQRWPAR